MAASLLHFLRAAFAQQVLSQLGVHFRRSAKLEIWGKTRILGKGFLQITLKTDGPFPPFEAGAAGANPHAHQGFGHYANRISACNTPPQAPAFSPTHAFVKPA